MLNPFVTQVVSPKPSYLESELAGATSTLTFGLIGTAAAIVFVGAIVFAANRAWMSSHRNHLKQLEVVRDRQQLQGEGCLVWRAVTLLCLRPAG